MSFRFRIFVAAFGASAASLAVAALPISQALRSQLVERIERNLVAQARLAAELLSDRALPATPAEFDVEADDLGAITAARVTLIGPDGTVVGDSSVSRAELATVENHGERPEVRAARRTGLGLARRYSTTVDTEMLYVAVPVRHPAIAVVRLALPLTEVQAQVASVRALAMAGLAVALGGALALSWAISTLLARRVREIAARARRYTEGDLSPSMKGFGRDELGHVARVLDESVHELGRRLEEQARDRARMDAMLAGMVEGVLVVGSDGRLQLANEAARRMLRLHGEPIGRHFLEFVRQPDVAAALAAALEGRATEGRDIALHHEPTRTFFAQAAPVLSKGASGAVLVLHDISELRRADQIRRDFVANVSHELRTPLTAIRGYVEALVESVPPDGETARFLEIIARHTNRMERLVRDLLRLARLDAGQETLEITACATDRLVGDVVAELRPSIDLRGQDVIVTVAPEVSTVQVDVGKLHDALRNLLENAVNYAPELSTITVEVTARNGRTVIAIGDRGPGIPEAELTRVFERFYRVDRARARDPGGTGLGLAIVKHLISLHGGTVRAANRPGGGAMFTIDLPASPEHPA